jgi:hypothetical protein
MPCGRTLAKCVPSRRSDPSKRSRPPTADGPVAQPSYNSVKWFGKYAATRTDKELSWYTEQGAPGTEHEVTGEDVTVGIEQLKRISKIVLR